MFQILCWNDVNIKILSGLQLSNYQLVKNLSLCEWLSSLLEKINIRPSANNVRLAKDWYQHIQSQCFLLRIIVSILIWRITWDNITQTGHSPPRLTWLSEHFFWKSWRLLRSQSARSAPQHSDCGRERHPRSKASPVQLSKPSAVLYNTPAVHLIILPSTVSITTYFLLCPRGLNMETGPRRRLTDKGFVWVFVLSFKWWGGKTWHILITGSAGLGPVLVSVSGISADPGPNILTADTVNMTNTTLGCQPHCLHCL